MIIGLITSVGLLGAYFIVCALLGKVAECMVSEIKAKWFPPQPEKIEIPYCVELEKDGVTKFEIWNIESPTTPYHKQVAGTCVLAQWEPKREMITCSTWNVIGWNVRPLQEISNGEFRAIIKFGSSDRINNKVIGDSVTGKYYWIPEGMLKTPKRKK